MALIFFTGGESGILDFTSSSLVVCSGTQKRTGNYSLHWGAWGGQFATQIFPSVQTELFFSCAVFMHSYSTLAAIFDFRSGASSVVSVRASSASSAWQLFVGGTSVATGTALLGIDVWHIIEVHIKIHSSTGLIHFRVDGIDDAIFSGNTAVVASNVNTFYSGPASFDFYLDDLVINDTTGTINNSWMGGTKIVALRPIGPGSLTQWTPSTGVNWDCVDETPISETDYVSGNLVGATDLYDLASLPASICSNASFLGVKVFNDVVRSGITISYLENGLRTNSSSQFSSAFIVPSVSTMQTTIWELNPVTGTTWSYTDINALEAGVKLY